MASNIYLSVKTHITEFKSNSDKDTVSLVKYFAQYFY